MSIPRLRNARNNARERVSRLRALNRALGGTSSLIVLVTLGCATGDSPGRPVEVAGEGSAVARPVGATGGLVRLSVAAGEPGSLPPALSSPLGLDALVPSPEANLLTPSKVELGRNLFVDPLLSRDRTISCASCHLPDHGFADSARTSAGVAGVVGSRNAPALINRAFGRSFFHDGRASTLEEAVLMPIVDPEELGLDLAELERRLAEAPRYRRFFAEAFPEEPISATRVGEALAAYIRTLLVGDAPIDRYTAGDIASLSPSAVRGRALFLGRAGCGDCHAGPNFTDERFHNTGVAAASGDPGRFTVTGLESDRGRFRTPTLRQLIHTAPYMHDGSMNTLEDVIEFYDRGGTPHRQLDSRIQTLGLNEQDRDDLLAFLHALSRP